MKKSLYVLVCPAETLVLGTLALNSGQVISEKVLRLDLEAAPACEKGDLLKVANTGQPLVCPRCRNQLVLGAASAELHVVIKESVRIVVGSTAVK